MARSTNSQILFGGNKGWHVENWIASDDRVRGGSSQSYLDCHAHSAEFHGILDTKTLGGAGFASQRTTGDDRNWDLSSFDGIELLVDSSNTDQKTYTFILKDKLLPPDPDTGREQASISWEHDFHVDSTVGQSEDDSPLRIIFISWKDLVPTYRGKEKQDAGHIDLHHIKRMSIMMRSFFDTQKGGFLLTLAAISAETKGPTFDDPTSQSTIEPTNQASSSEENLKDTTSSKGSSLWQWLFGKNEKL